MHELFPVLAGLVIALVVHRLPNPRMCALALVALSVIAGVTASYISGENGCEPSP